MKAKPLYQTPELFATLFLLATLSLSPDWLLILLPTFFLASTRETTWLPLSLFATFALFRHLFLDPHHLWSFGLELSFATSLLLASLGLKLRHREAEALTQALEKRKQQEEQLILSLAQAQGEKLDERNAFQAQLASLEKTLHQKNSDLSALTSLNEILRSGHAKSLQEKLDAEKNAADSERALLSLQDHCRLLEQELKRLTHTEGVASQNRELFEELNQARLEKAQTQLINETLARLHAQSLLQAQEATCAKHALETNLQREKEHFDAQLGARDTEIRELSERLAKAREQVHEFAKIEPLFRQLKQQFEEKNQILHETRRDLFHKETEVQRLEIELKEREGQQVPSKLLEEVAELEQSLVQLEEENRLLLELLQKWGKEGAEVAPKAPKKKKKSAAHPELLSF